MFSAMMSLPITMTIFGPGWLAREFTDEDVTNGREIIEDLECNIRITVWGHRPIFWEQCARTYLSDGQINRMGTK